jgi:hypothetical protein
MNAADAVSTLSTAVAGQLVAQAGMLEGEILSIDIVAAIETQATLDSDARAALSTEIRTAMNGQDGAAG